MEGKNNQDQSRSTKELSKDELWTRYDVSRFFGVSLATVSAWTSKDLLKAYRMNTRVYYLKSEVLAFLKSPPK